jgi:hypothetical protein
VRIKALLKGPWCEVPVLARTGASVRERYKKNKALKVQAITVDCSRGRKACVCKAPCVVAAFVLGRSVLVHDVEDVRRAAARALLALSWTLASF